MNAVTRKAGTLRERAGLFAAVNLGKSSKNMAEFHPRFRGKKGEGGDARLTFSILEGREEGNRRIFFNGVSGFGNKIGYFGTKNFKMNDVIVVLM